MFVILVLPKNTYAHEFETNDLWCNIRVDHDFIKEYTEIETPQDSRRVLYADSQVEAEKCAQYLAGKWLGREVAVLQPTSIFSAERPNITQKQVNENGVLPR